MPLQRKTLPELNKALMIKLNSTTTSKFLSYNGTKYGATIQYPQNWKVKEDSNGVWFISPVDETGNVRIESQKSLNGSLALTVQTQLMLPKTAYKELDIASTNMTMLARFMQGKDFNSINLPYILIK